MTTIKWEVNTLQREIVDGYVNKVIYRVDAIEGEEKFRATGEVNLERPEVLTPYEDLTEELVLGWVKDFIGEEGVEKIEEAIVAGLAKKLAPVTAVGKPW